MTTRQLWRWQHLHERRARAWRSPWLAAVVAGAVLHVPVAWQTHASTSVASETWLVLAIAAFAFAALRAPFHIYWRADAALLARLPIEGGPLVDVVLVRCLRAAAATTLALVLAALPIARTSSAVFVHDLAVAGTLGACAAGLVPGSAFAAAAIVALDPRAKAGAILGALPGVIASVTIVVCVLGGDSGGVLGVLAMASLLALLLSRALAPKVMARILRDVSALDRQHLATLEIHAPTALERVIASALGSAGVVYRKDARLMRRRYPMAFALGALASLVLVIVALARPDSQVTCIEVTVTLAVLYALVLARRLWRAPIELPRLAATLPITSARRAVAKLAWVAGWSIVFIGLPALIAFVRL
jgi:hypothetical protein